MTMTTENSIDIKVEFDEETFQGNSSGLFQQNEEIAQSPSEDMCFETLIKIEDPEEKCENPILADKFPDGNSFEKEQTAHICLICGSNTTTNSNEYSREKWMANENWRKECAETICNLLLTSDSQHFNQFFQIAQYCSSCQKLIWEADFTRRLIVSLQKTIEKLSITLRGKFALNFIKLKSSQQVANKKDCRPSTSKNVEHPVNPSFSVVDHRICTENSSAFNQDAQARKDVPLRLFTKSKITDKINSKTKAKRSKRKNKRWTNNAKPHTRMALEINQILRKMSTQEAKTQQQFSTVTEVLDSFNLADVPRKRGRPKKKIVHDQIKENELLFDKTSTVSENNVEFCDYENDYGRSPNDNCEVEERDSSPEKQTQRGLENDILNSEEIVTQRQRKPPQRFTIEDTRLKSDELSDDILSDDDEEQPKKTPRKGTQEEHEDDEDYVPEKGERTDMEKWWHQKAKERFKRRNPNPTNFPCPIEGCQNTYKRSDVLQRHIRIVHEGINYYHCEFCPKTFYTRSKLDRHKTTHPEYNITINDPKYLKPIHDYEFICTICGQGYNSEEELTAHNEIHAGSNPFVCFHCKKECTNASELKAHIGLEHDDETPKCNKCGKTFVSNQSLQQHKKIHLNPEECFSCPHCPFVSANKSSFNSHVARLHGETQGVHSVQCETCGKTLKHVNYLREHMKIHTGEKAYKCGICEKRFTTNGIRNRHERIHSGIRPHVCSFCGKALTTADNLKVHELIHTRDPNVPLPKRIYKKPFPKKKKKVKPPVDNDTGNNSSSQSQNIIPH